MSLHGPLPRALLSSRICFSSLSERSKHSPIRSGNMLDIDGESLWQAMGEEHNRYSVEIFLLVQGIGVVCESSLRARRNPRNDGILVFAKRVERKTEAGQGTERRFILSMITCIQLE